jgi:hypothetical protein
MDNLENYYVTGGFDIIKKRYQPKPNESPDKVPIYTASEGPNGSRPRRSDALIHLAINKDSKIINRDPFKPRVEFEAILRQKGAVGIDGLEELREEQENEVDEELK